ncbi:MAG: hypothetical protein LBE20_02090, partial [Deltaproteobacteria bacterium]|nr:hypothetical protein [Deltaproteobacteria bacterium]
MEDKFYFIVHDVKKLSDISDYSRKLFLQIYENLWIKNILLCFVAFFISLGSHIYFPQLVYSQSSTCSGTKSCFGGAFIVGCNDMCPTCYMRCANGSFVACGESCPANSSAPRRKCSSKCCMSKPDLTCDDGKYRPYGTKICVSCLDSGVSKCNNETGEATECTAGNKLSSGKC